MEGREVQSARQLVFGKKTSLSLVDLKRLEAEHQEEGAFLECVGCETLDPDSINSRFREDNIVKPLLGFLTKIDELGGILLLGVAAKDKRVDRLSPIRDDLLRESQVRDWILADIGSLPQTSFPYLDITKIPTDDGGAVIVIEIQPTDSHAVFYSKKSNLAYIRNGDRVDPLALPQFLNLLQERRCAKVRINIDEGVKQSEVTGGTSEWAFALSWRNEGSEPGRHVAALIRIHLTGKASSPTISGDNVSAITDIYKDGAPSFMAQVGHSPDSIFAYPEISTVFGSVRIQTSGAFDLTINVRTMEEKGQMLQVYRIDGDQSRVSVREMLRHYESYLK